MEADRAIEHLAHGGYARTDLDAAAFAQASAPPASRKIILATIGSLGDLHPFIALGLSLQARGFHVILAVPQDHVGKVTRAGLAAVAIMPRFETIWADMGLTQAEAIRRIIEDQDFMIRRIAIPAIDEGVRALDAIAADACAIVGSLFALAAPIVAEKRGIPLIPAFLQPMTVFSAYDPPVGQKYGTIAEPARIPSRMWNRACFRIVRLETRRRYAALINRARAAHGLARQASTPILDMEAAHALRLGLYPAFFAPPQPDFPGNFDHVGFPLLDAGADSGTALDPAFERFLADGPAPLVFTLGSLVTACPRDFYRESADLARALGMRAVLLTGGAHATASRDIIVRDYAPHALIFPRAAAIIHHGGIGTTAQALRAGVPQLVVPHMGDQIDNAARIARLAVGQRIDAARYTAVKAAPVLAQLLRDDLLRERARALAVAMQSQNGAEDAAQAIETALG